MAWAHDVEVDGIYYNLNQTNKTASVTYKGTSFSAYNEYVGEIVIPSYLYVNGTKYYVSSLGKECFDECTDLTSIVLPKSDRFLNLENN